MTEKPLPTGEANLTEILLDALKRAAAARATPHATGGTPAARLVWPLALACGVLVIFTGISIYLVLSARATGDLVNRALRAQTELNGVLATLRAPATSQRGYPPP